MLHDLRPTALMLAGGAARPLLRLLRATVNVSGALALVLAALAFTRVPFDAHRWLGTAAGECAQGVQRIVVLGGSGMPSGPELLRLKRAADLALEAPHAAVVIIHPGDSSVIGAMRDELVLRGVAVERIALINAGNNTREQALALLRARPVVKPGATAIVTAPENMCRSVLAFRKAGIPSACGAPAWDHAMFHDFAYDHRAMGGKAWLPDVSGRPMVRYTFWNYLKLEVTCLREFLALAYYRLNGWI